MNVFHKVTLQSLKKNKTRTIVTIIGIMLSAAMICAVTTMFTSLQNYLYENFCYQNGSWHGSVVYADTEDLEHIQNSNEIEDLVAAPSIGYAILDEVNVSNKPYLYIYGATEGFFEMLPVKLTTGEYPKNENEIILTELLLDSGGVSYKIGDTITMEIGDRVSEGWFFGQDTKFIGWDKTAEEYEEFIGRETRTYTVVGFFGRPNVVFDDSSTAGFSAITAASAEEITSSSHYDVFFTLKNPKNTFRFMEKNGFPMQVNYDVLTSLGVSGFTDFYTVLYGLIAIVIGLIMFGSVSLIYNAFSISVSERTKQFGLLSSIGATKRQLRKMVLFEALDVSLIGIPLGIIVGISGIGITLACIGDRFSTLMDFAVPMHLHVLPMTIVSAVAIAWITVLISAWIPSRRATQISAVEAIRQTCDITINAKQSGTSRITYKLFGLPGVIASKHFKRNRKKYRTTVVSLFMSIVLFVSASAFTDYLTESAADVYDLNGFDVAYYLDPDDTRNLPVADFMEFVRSNETVTEAAYTRRDILGCFANRSDLTDEWMYDVVRSTEVEMEEDSPTEHISLAVIYVDDNTFRNFLKENNLNEQEYTNAEKPLAVAVDGITRFHIMKEKFVTTNVLKTGKAELTTEFIMPIDGYAHMETVTNPDGTRSVYYINRENSEEIVEYSEDEAIVIQTLQVGAAVYEKPWFLDTTAELILLYPDSVRQAVNPFYDNIIRDYSILIRTDNHSECFASLSESLRANGMSDNRLVDYAENEAQDRAMLTIIEVFAYGFIVLISLIAAANVFNTISTNISLRRREFAMLKSVGMSAKGFNRMMNYECLLYGTKSLLYGIPVSCAVTYLIFCTVSSGLSTGFRLPWGAIGIAVLSVFLVVSATMMYSMSKIRQENPIDALRNENL